MDRLDYSKGLLHRLLGFEHFLEKYPKWHGKIVFNMVVIPSRESVGRYQDMKKEIEAAVGRINGKYGSLTWRPVVYQYQSLTFPEMVALYDLSDVGLITPIRDGMNLVAKEYLACQRTNLGVLILSEMAGAAAELSEAILINPTDKAEVAAAIAKALDMPLADRQAVLERMQKRLQTYDVFAWAKDFFDTMDRTKQEQHVLKVRLVNRSIENQIVQKYHKAARRIIFLDYDGTLVPFSRYPETAVPSEQVLAQLKRLAADARNTVVIVSGRSREFLDKWFGRPADRPDRRTRGLRPHPARGLEQRGGCGPDMETAGACRSSNGMQTGAPGPSSRRRRLSLVWHYRNADPEIALLRSQELKDELRELVSHDSRLQVMEGHKVIEVKKSGYDKGSVAVKLLGTAPYDFILAIGDDKTDEDLFRALPAQALTIKIGIIRLPGQVQPQGPAAGRPPYGPAAGDRMSKFKYTLHPDSGGREECSCSWAVRLPQGTVSSSLTQRVGGLINQEHPGKHRKSDGDRAREDYSTHRLWHIEAKGDTGGANPCTDNDRRHGALPSPSPRF